MADKGLFGGEYDNIDDAAAGALLVNEYQPNARKQEYMTLLVRDPRTGKIRREAFQTQGNEVSSQWSGYPQGQIVGIVHNHPAYREGKKYPGFFLSNQDLNTARQMQVPSYIAAMQPPGHGPADTRTYNPPKGATSKLNVEIPGEQFLAQYPIEEMKMIMAQRIRNSNMNPAMKTRLLERLLVPTPSQVRIP